jgi:hypothetical protein
MILGFKIDGSRVIRALGISLRSLRTQSGPVSRLSTLLIFCEDYLKVNFELFESDLILDLVKIEVEDPP